MSYLTENPWPVIIVLIAVAVVGFLTGSGKGRAVAGVCAVLCVALFFLERYLVSPGEEIEQRVELLLEEFRAADIDGIGEILSSQNQGLKDTAARGLELVEIEDSFHIASVDVSINETDSDEDSARTAVAMIRANGNLTLLKHGGGSRHVPTYWKTTWVFQNDQWRLDKVVRLNPANGKEMGILSAQQ